MKAYKQKFHKGDVVMIAKDLGPSMRHFTAGCIAIVQGSYADQYGGTDKDSKTSYTLLIGVGHPTSWYHEHQLTLVEKSSMASWKLYQERMFLKYKKEV